MERMRPEIRPAGEDEADPSRAVRSHPRSGWQLIERPGQGIGAHDKDVAGISPRQVRRDLQARIFARRDVLRAMDDHVHRASEKSALDVRNEGAFTPDRVRCAAIALGLDDDQAATPTDARERLGDQPGLGKRERAASSADPDHRSSHSPNSSRMARS